MLRCQKIPSWYQRTVNWAHAPIEEFDETKFQTSQIWFVSLSASWTIFSLGSFTILIFSPPQTTLKSSHLGPRIQHPATSSPGGCGPSSSPPTSRNFYRWWTLTGLAFARLKIALWRNSLHFAETKTGFNIRAVIYLAKRHLQCWGLALTFHRSTSRLDAIDVETHGLGPELQFLSNITQLSCWLGQ